MSEEFAADYVSSLADLTVNSKPHINMLTMLADDNVEHAAAIVKAVEKHLEKVPSETKLPVLYLIDSIIKNVAGDYKTLFTQNIANTFCNAFEKVDEKTRANLFKLRQTWNGVIPSKKLYLLDTKVNIIDPAWPITAPPPKIHVNPRFLNTNSPTASSSPTPAPASPVAPALPADATMREQLLQKQKKLLELQQEKLRLELLQTQAQLEEQQKMLEKQTVHLKPVSETSQQKKTKMELLQTQAQLEEQKKQLTKQSTESSTSLRKLMQKFTNKDTSKSSKSSAKNSSSPVALVPPTKSSAKVDSVPKAVVPTSKTESPKASSKLESVMKPSIGKGGDVLLKPFATAELNTSPPSKKSSPNKSKFSKTSNAKTDVGQVLKPKPQPTAQEKRETPSADLKPVATVPPVTQPRIAPVSSQLIIAARRTRDPRILRRQMEETQPQPPPKPHSPPKIELSPKPKAKSITEDVKIKSHSKQKDAVKFSVQHALKPKSKKDKKSSRQSREERQNRIYRMVQDLKTAKSQGTVKSPPVEKHKTSNVSKSPLPPSNMSPSNVSKEEKLPPPEEKVPSKVLKKNVRNQEGSKSPPITGDVDLRHALAPPSDDHKKEIVGNAAISTDMDVDLRQFPVSPAKKRPSVERSEAPPPKKSKAEVFDELFGKEDVDLRTLPPPSPPLPSPPPPPVISLSPPPEGKDNGTERSWAKYKQQKPETFKSQYRCTPLKPPSLKKGYGNPPNWRAKGKPYLYNDTDMRHQFGPGSNYDIIIKQAHEQYNSGSLTDNDYKKIVTEVISMNEIRQVEEAQRLDEEELRKEEAYEELEPISDDEISAYSENHLVPQNENAESTQEINVDDIALPRENHSTPPDEKTSSLNEADDVDLSRVNDAEISNSNDQENDLENDQENEHKMIVDSDEKTEELLEKPSVDVEQNRYSDTDKNSRKTRSTSEDYSPRSRVDIGHRREDPESKESDKKRYPRERDRRDEYRSYRQEQKLRRRMEIRENRTFRKNRYGQAEKEVWDSPPFEARHSENKSPVVMDHPAHVSYNTPDIPRPVALDKGSFDDGETVMDVDISPPNLSVHPTRFGNDSNAEPHESSLARPPGSWESRHPSPWIRNIPPLMRPLPLLRLPVEMQRFGPNRWRGPMPSVTPLRPPFEGDNTRFNRFAIPPSSGSPRPPTLGPGELPSADPHVLELIAADPTNYINIDGKSKDIRFYGDIAVVMTDWDDPREISFKAGQRRIIVDERDTMLISFNTPYRDMLIDGQPHRVRFGAPTRELYIDGKWHECYFGGPPISVEISGKMCSVKLEGPPPQVLTGGQRKDLVVGRVRLIVDAKYIFDLYLDPKPQRFEIEGTPIIIRFVEALRTLVINGVSFKADFGGLPKPFFLKGKKHFFRLTTLPLGVHPGYLTIVNMEGGRLQSPPPQGALPAPPQIPLSLQTLDLDIGPDGSNDDFVPPRPPQPSVTETVSPKESERSENTGSSEVTHHPPQNIGQNQLPQSVPVNPLDMLASLLPPAPASRTSNYSYSVESESTSPTIDAPPTATKPAPIAATGTTPFLSGEINVGELLQKLIASGIVSNATKPTDTPTVSKEKPADVNAIIPVDFGKPETLKTRQPGIVTAFYSGIQCSSCGVRFPPEQTMKYSQHLDWHFRQNRRDKDSARMAQSRKWYYDISDWIQFEEIEDLEERAQSWFESQAGQNSNGAEAEEPPGEVPSVAAGESPEDAACEICRDKFEQFYNEEREEWHLRQAIRVDDKLYHPICHQDHRASLDAPIEVSLDESEDAKDEEVTAVETAVPVVEQVDDDDDLEVIECEIIQPVFPIEDLTTSDCESIVDATEERTDPMQEEQKDEEFDSVMMDVEQTNEQIPSVDKNEGNDVPEIIVEDKVEDITTIDVEAVVKNIKREPLDDEIMDSEMEIKKEREDIDMPEPVVDTTHVAVECSIDGNLQFEDSPQIAVSAPPKIKINITKPLLVQPAAAVESKEVESDIMDNETPVLTPSLPLSVFNTIVETQQPPPPGEEPGPLHLKPRLLGKKLQDLPPLSKGAELSGLCSIM